MHIATKLTWEEAKAKFPETRNIPKCGIWYDIVFPDGSTKPAFSPCYKDCEECKKLDN